MRLIFALSTIQVCLFAAGCQASDLDSLQVKVAERALLLAKEAAEAETNSSRRLMISESKRQRYPKLLPGDGTRGAGEDASKLDRLTEDKGTLKCDQAFFECMGVDACDACFFDMKTHDIDWAGVSQKTECNIVTGTLQKAGLCKSLGTSQTPAKETFCKTFAACVYFDDDEAEDDPDKDLIDCDSLTECNWPGIHKSFIGDGVCHDSYFNTCYNSKICGYDGGDCCEDTCKSEKDAYLQCGADGFSCRDTNSTKCDSKIEARCPSKKEDGDSMPSCTEDQTLYKLIMYDSFGDGWEATSIKISLTTGGTTGQKLTPVYEGGLSEGAEGTVYMCLSLNPTCYDVEVGGGNWGREASWVIRGFAPGSPAIAQGGGSVKCTFGVAGGTCTNTCIGGSNVDPSSDQDYKDFKKMSKCIDEKCMIQADACRADAACVKCFNEDVPDYCFSIEHFLAVADCSMCKCTDSKDTEFCEGKAAPGIVPISPKNGGTELAPVECTPTETMAGASALINFHQCMDFDKESMLMEDFDQNNFGLIDTFEACAHGFRDDDNHGGRTAKSCLQILVSAMDAKEKEGEPTKAIAEMAKHLYNDGEIFCDCAKSASDECPLCPSFYNFKTLLYETIDACTALDDIDCDAWNDFQEPCKVNLMKKFGSVNFMDGDQCDFIQSGCDSAGPFPSFRRLDCEKELPVASWDLYKQYSDGCVGDIRPVAPMTPPAAAPVPPKTRAPTPYEPVNPSNIKPNGGTTPSYVPPDKSNTKPSYKSPDGDSSSSHWFRNLVLLCLAGGIGYFVYKKRSDGFNFVQYRRMPTFGGYGNVGMDDGDMYSGLALESSTNFEPPSLPPTPMSMSNNGGYGA